MNMRKLILLMSVVLSVAAMAQNVEKQVQQIRKVYQEVKARIAADESPYEGGMAVVKVNGKANYSAIGGQENNMTVYAEHHQDMDDRFNTYDVALIIQTFNVAPRKMYREYLYDLKTRKLIFCLLNDEEYTGENTIKRFYYNRGRLIKADPKAVKGEGTQVFAQGDRMRQMAEMLLDGCKY